MESSTVALRIGDWNVDPIAGQISRNGEVVRVEARTLKLLLVLAERAGETVSIEELLDRVWVGVVVTPESVYQAVATLRRLLGDDSKQPRYIVTVPRLGYRMIASVAAAGSRPPARRPRRRLVAIGVGVAGIALIVGLVFVRLSGLSFGHRQASQLSVGVAPFVDLTPTMDQAQLADEMTEGLADRLSRNPALHTPGFRSSYYLIGRRTSIAQVARTLAVAYVVDGSVRRSGETIRISARLVRAESGVVLWSQVFDQPLRTLSTAQDDIARTVAATLIKVSAG
jgi:transcriptional activator of cad operon